MYAAYHLRADELNNDVIQTLKDTYDQRELIILSKEAYEEELEKIRRNAAFTEKLRRGIQDLEEGKGIVKTMAELEALANE
jgi:hypothetical protein